MRRLFGSVGLICAVGARSAANTQSAQWTELAQLQSNDRVLPRQVRFCSTNGTTPKSTTTTTTTPIGTPPPRNTADLVVPSQAQREQAIKLLVQESQLEWSATLFDEIAVSTEEVLTDGGATTMKIITNPDGWPCFGGVDVGSTLLVQRQWLSNFWSDVVCNDDFYGLHALIGTPGIGKSVGLYALLRLILLHSSKLLRGILRFVVMLTPEHVAGRDMRLYDLTEKKGCIVPWHRFNEFKEILAELGQSQVFRSDILVLHDINKAPPLTTPHLNTILASSRGNLGGITGWCKYASGRGCTQHFVPCYSDAEMDLITSHSPWDSFDYARSMGDPEVKTWRGMAHYFGNVPRWVFSKGGASLKLTLSARIDSFNDYEMLKAMCGAEKDAHLAGPDAFLILTSLQTVTIRCPFVAQGLADKFAKAWVEKWSDFVAYCYATDAHAYELLSRLFIARHPKCFPMSKVKFLNSGPKIPLLTLDSWIDEPMQLVQWSQGTIELETQKYYCPTLPGEAFADGFKYYCPQSAGKKASLTVFQFTLAPSHHTTAEKVTKFFKHVERSLLMNGKPIEIILTTQGELQLHYEPKANAPKEFVVLEIHVVYVIQERQLGRFTLQSCTGTSAEYPTLPTYWENCVAQHVCLPPSKEP